MLATLECPVFTWAGILAVLEISGLKNVSVITEFSWTAMPKHTVSTHCRVVFSIESVLSPELGAFLSSVHGFSNSPVSHLLRHFTEKDTETQKEESPVRGHRAGTWRKSARAWTLLWLHCLCHCLPRMEATPAPSTGPGPTLPTLYKALVPKKLYINHPFLPALVSPVCKWGTLTLGLGFSVNAMFHSVSVF